MNRVQTARLINLLVRGTRAKGARRWGVLLVALLVGYVLIRPSLERQLGISLPDILNSDATVQDSGSGSPSTTLEMGEGEQQIVSAFESRRSDVIVVASARIVKLLPDDNVGDRHQKMILKLSSGHTLLLAHNIDLAPRVPAEEGDHIEFKGEYEYSEQGGVIHWTHHDPRWAAS